MVQWDGGCVCGGAKAAGEEGARGLYQGLDNSITGAATSPPPLRDIVVETFRLLSLNAAGVEHSGMIH